MKHIHFAGALLILCLFILNFDTVAQSLTIKADVAGGTDVNEMRLGYNPSTGVYYQNSYQNSSYNHLYFSQNCSLQPAISIDTALTSKFSKLKPQILRFPGGEEANYFHFYNGKNMGDTTCFQSNEFWNKGNGYNIEEVLFKAPFYHAVNTVQYDPMFNRNYIFDFVDMVKEMERKSGEKIEVLFVANLLQFFKHQSIFHLIPECLDPQENCFQDKLQEIVNAVHFLKIHGVNVVGVELGNEMWADHKMKIGGANELTASKYFQLCNEVSDRLKSEFMNMPVGILVHQATCFNEESVRSKWNNELKVFFEKAENRQKYDAFVLHAYYDAFNKKRNFGPCVDYDFGSHGEDDLFSRKYVLDYLEEIHNISTDKEIWYTEWNGSKSSDFNLNQKLKHSMFIQNMIMSFLEFNRIKGRTIVKYENLHTAAGVGDANGATTQLLRMSPPLNSTGSVNAKSRKVNFTSSGFIVSEQLVPILNHNRPLVKLQTENNVSYKDVFINNIFTDLFFINDGDSKQLLLYYVNKGQDSIFLNIESIINSSSQIGYLPWSIKHQYVSTGNSPTTSMQGESLTDENLFAELKKQSNPSEIFLKGYAMGYITIDLAENASCAYFDVIPTECQSSYTFIPKESEGLHTWIVSGDAYTYTDTILNFTFKEGNYTVYHIFLNDRCLVDTFEYKLSVNPKLTLDYLVVEKETCHQKNGGFEIKIEGGAPPFKIQYNDKEVIVNSNVFKFGSFSSGNYNLSINDYNNCSIDTHFTVIDTAIGLCDFVTVWDLSKKGFFLNDNISFFKDVAKGGTTYTWEEISPGLAKGSGRISAGEGSVLLSGFPSNSLIRLTISHENLNGFYINKNENRQRLVEVEQWGIASWKSMENAFSGCTNLEITATDIPDLSDVSSMSQMFQGCISLKGQPSFNYWDTESVQDFSQMFRNAGSFNQDISNWDTENATDMSNMFRNASSFNQNINEWITDNVINMASMFSEASSFNQPIGNWLLNPFVNMTYMLDNCGMDCQVYSEVLNDWSSNPATPQDIRLGATGMEYGTVANKDRSKLTENKGWKILGDIALPETCFSCETKTITKYITICDSSELTTNIDSLITPNGCDSIITTIAILLPSYNIEINTASCNAGDTGVFVEHLMSKDGCDSIVTTITALLPSKEEIVYQTTCDANEEGKTVERFSGVNGCDSIITTIFTLSSSYETIVNQTTCDPIKEGVDFEINTSLNGCDSIVMIITDLLPSYEMTVYETTCDSSLVRTITSLFSTLLGCDSVITTITTLLPSYNIEINKVTNNKTEIGKVLYNLTSNNGCDSIVTIITSYVENERPFAKVEYWTNFDSNIDRYWSLHSDGVSMVEPRTKTKGNNRGKTNIVFSTKSPQNPRYRPKFSIGHADLHIDLKSVLPLIDVKMDCEWKKFDKWNNANSSNDTIGIYYIDQTTGLIRFVSEYEGNGTINLSDWARSNRIVLSDKAVIRFLYRTDAVFNQNNFNSGGLHIESVHIYQNTLQTLGSEYPQTDSLEKVYNIESQARKNNLSSNEESLFDNTKFDVSVYPNPVKLGEKINLELPLEVAKEVHVELIDILGRRIDHVLVGTSDLFGQIISISTEKARATGTYFLKIESGNQKSIKKIQVVKN